MQEAVGGVLGSEEWKMKGKLEKEAAVKEVSGDQPGVGGPRIEKVEETS